MILCWDNINKLTVSRTGNLRCGTSTITFGECAYCGEEMLYNPNRDHKNIFCSNECIGKFKQVSKDHKKKLATRSAQKRFSTPQGWALRTLGSTKARAKKFGVDCDLTPEWLVERFLNGCELTGSPFVIRGGIHSPSIDRIDPDKGYTQSNCRLITLAMNMFKGRGTDADMEEAARAFLDKLDQTKRPHLRIVGGR